MNVKGIRYSASPVSRTSILSLSLMTGGLGSIERAPLLERNLSFAGGTRKRALHTICGRTINHQLSFIALCSSKNAVSFHVRSRGTAFRRDARVTRVVG